MYPYGYICLSDGLHLRLAVEGNNTFLYCLFPNILLYAYSTSVNIIFTNHYKLIVKY